ncbi:MAG: hypothetical protein MR458_03555 [Erysipelotrichaceae bacterium]|nr:hypothetical protein [Erysipelotrichaceae bacterium]
MSSNRFVNWMKEFDYKVKNETELIDIIENYITRNNQINSRTKAPPALLFKEEKDYLRPIGNKMNLETYIQNRKRLKVPNILLVSYKSSQYSVSCNYIGKYIDVISVGSELYIYHNHSLITVHTLTEEPIN